MEVGNLTLPLKTEVPLDKLQELVEAVTTFLQYVDIEKLGKAIEEEEEELPIWDKDELREFAIKNLRDSQAIALDILINTKEITREDFVSAMKTRLSDPKFRGWSLGGLLAGITMKAKSWGYESLYDSEWRTEGNESKFYYWIIRTEYIPVIRDALKERK